MLRHFLPLHLHVKEWSGYILSVEKLRADFLIYSEMLCEIIKEREAQIEEVEFTAAPVCTPLCVTAF